MKKVLFLTILTVVFFIKAPFVYADAVPKGAGADYNTSGYTKTVNDVLGKIVPPSPIQPMAALGGAGGLSFFLSRVVQLIYTGATLAFVFMILISAFQWIVSGGEKEAVAKARGRLINAMIGIMLLAFTFVFLNIISSITGFEFFAR